MPEAMTFPSPIRLLPRPGSDGGSRGPGDPFSLLSADGQPFRAYLACLEVGGRVLVPRLTILMEPNEYPGSIPGSVATPIGNLQIERIWQRGFSRHRTVKSKAIVRIDERALPGGDREGDVPRHSPLAWCRKTEAYATPLCPICLRVMRTCRDEELLRRSGLPSYKSSLIRFLCCHHCSTEAKHPPTFYTYSLRKIDGLAKGVQLRRRSELYRDLGSRISSADAPPDPSGTGTEADRSSSVGDLHPCWSCEHRPSCYPVGRHVDDRLPAEELLFPLAYYDFFWIPLEPLSLEFRETAALLGGASLADLRSAQSGSDDGTSMDGEMSDELDRPTNQFFFEGDTTGLYALESLYLKLSALADLARGIRDLFEATGFAHLALSPDRLRGSLSIGPTILPTRWGLALKIGDLLTTAPPILLEADAVPGESEVGCLPHPCPETFLPAGMSRPQIENLWMRLTVDDLRMEESGGEWKALLQARLTAPDVYRGAEHGIHDLVRVVLIVGPTRGQRIVFSGHKAGTVPGGFLFSGTTGPLSDAARAALESADLPVSSSVEVTLAHVFSTPADIMSLGLLMLRLLLTNDSQDTTRLNARLAGDLAEAVSESLTASGFGVNGRIHEPFKREEFSTEPTEVLYRKIDRTSSAAAIPSGLWEDALLLALRMASNLPDWSICATQDDYPASNPTEPLRFVVQELEELVERARGSLIGSAGRNACVQEVCDDFLADLKDAGPPSAGPAPGDTFEKTRVSPPGAKPA